MGKKWKLVLPIALFILLLCTVCASAACSHKWELESMVGGSSIGSEVQIYRCTVCGETNKVVLSHDEDCRHKWELEGRLGGNCLHPAVDIYRCTVCGETKKVDVGTIDRAAHNSISRTKYIAPTCTSAGRSMGEYCDDCGTVLREVEVIPPKGHTGKVTKAPKAATCTTAGWTVHVVCQDCGMTLSSSKPIPAKGHVVKVTKAPKAATCTTAGWTVNVVCQNCGVTLSASKAIPAKGHTVKVTKAPKAATCTTAGWTVNVVCKDCGVTLSASKAIPKLGHSKKTKSVGTNLLQDYCERCGMLFDHVYLDENAYPKNFAASNVSNGIKLTWSEVINADCYTIWRNDKLIYHTTGLSYTDTSVSNGTQYTYKICAEYVSDAWGNRTNRVSKTYVYVSRPSKVTGTATKLTAASVSGATGYQIQVVDSASKSVYNTTATTNTRTISALKAGTYKIRARAYRTVSGVKYWSAWTAYTTFKVSSTATK